jgi:endonuclease/exonuclease/phosphatase family metal-dependent hydrolase
MNTHIRKQSRDVWLWLVLFSLIFPLSSATAKKEWDKKSTVKVMTQNLYLGADIFKVVEAAFIPDPENPEGPPIANPDPLAIPKAVTEVYQTMLYTNFPERAEAIANEIELCKPHVIALQEASTYYIQTEGDFLQGNPVQADELVIDFYTTLNAALEARGLHYQAFFVTNADIEMPMFNLDLPGKLSDVRLVDHDIILVRKGLWAKKAYNGNYWFNLSLNLGGTDVEFTRGYIAVEVKIQGEKYRFVNTHLEVRSEEESEFRVIQALQMNELLQLLENEKRPIIMLGDFNSSEEDEVFIHGVYGPIVPPYLQAIGKGYSDSWLLQENPGDGYTSGFDEFVSDPNSELTTRIDLIFVDQKKLKIENIKADVVGDEIEDMTPVSILWPSDHAGVVAKIRLSHKK